MKIYRHILFLAAIIAMTSCEKEIEFKYHDIPEQQVIEGLLTGESVSVRLTRTIPTDEPFNDRTVTDAEVTMTDLTSGREYSLQPDDKGLFTASGTIGTPGHDYALTVNIGNDTYTSTSHMFAPVEIVLAEFNWIKMPYDDVAVLKVLFTENDDMLARYWLRVYRNGEPYAWQAIESRNSVNGLVTGMMMTSRKDTDEADEDSVLKEGDVIDIEVLPISKTMADYLDSLNNGDYNGNRMFEGSYCLGYFLAAPIASSQLIYHPDDIPYAE